MKITYSNTPCNRQKYKYPSFRAIAAMACIIAVMVAIKVFYAPEESMEDVAAMANSVIDTGKAEESDTLEAAQTSVLYLSPVSYTEREEEAECFFPLQGEITSGFSQRQDPFNIAASEFHKGIDIAPRQNAAITSYTDGTVVMAGYDPSYGNFIKLSHEKGIETLYAHCDSLMVKEGDTVKAGQIIATAGETGKATGIHLHFEIRVNGECVDPLLFF